MENTYTEALKTALRSPTRFTKAFHGISLRQYQQRPAEAILASIQQNLGLTFVILFPRQSGKNELQAQLESYLLCCLSNRPAEIVKISPTWKPQSLNAMRRLERNLQKNLIAQVIGWQKESGYIYRVGQARCIFMSGSPTANIVGATASTLLECDEAQDVQPAKWDKEVAPMAASTNATRVFWGTAWTSQTLLSRELRAARAAQEQDGRQRVFRLTADDVAAELPAYGQFVSTEIAKHGRNHPFIRTQFFSEEIDSEGGMFPPSRIALMRGAHPRNDERPTPGVLYAFLIDVGGEDQSATADPNADSQPYSTHDSTVLTCIEIEPGSQQPRYRCIFRVSWTGAGQSAIFAHLQNYITYWQPRRIIIDATGIGAGLTNLLQSHHGATTVIPFVFTSKSKSDLAWNFISLIESGRYTEYTPFDETLLQQLQNCQLEIIPGPARLCKWGVPNGQHDPITGDLLHDDLILSAALVSELDNQPWGSAQSHIIQAASPLDNLTW